MKTLFATAAITMCFASAAMAETYKCDFARGGAGGWIRPTIMVKIDPEAGTAAVKDDITESISEGWYTAKIAANTKKRYTVNWTIDRLKDSKGQNVKADFRVSVFKATMKGQAMMSPLGYDNTFHTKGKCKLVK